MRSEPPCPDRLLTETASGDASAAEALFPLVYEELRAIAARKLASEPPGHTLQATALVNEAYLRLIDQTRARYRDRPHFFAVAARVMRRVLVDHARGKQRQKRGRGWHRVTLSTNLAGPDNEGVDALALDEALTELAAMNDRQARVVELRLFGELEVEEVAECLGVSATTVKDEWRAGRSWIRFRLEADHEA